MRIIFDGVLLFLLIMALVGYIEAEWPWMPEHESRVTVETVYWEGKYTEKILFRD